MGKKILAQMKSARMWGGKSREQKTRCKRTSNVDEIDSHLFKIASLASVASVWFFLIYSFFPRRIRLEWVEEARKKPNNSQPENEWWKYTDAK